MSKSIFGYYEHAGQSVPSYDPGSDVLCPVCLRQLSDPVRTVSLMAEHQPQRSYFYRLHRRCHEDASDEELLDIESSVINSDGAN